MFKLLVIFSLAISVVYSQSTANCASGGRVYNSQASRFLSGKFKTGVSFDYLNKNNLNAANFDYITIWLNTIDDNGSTKWNNWYQGAMLDKAKQLKKAVLFYGYVTAFEARAQKGIRDCDVDPNYNLCTDGANFIRSNRQQIIDKYGSNAAEIKKAGLTTPIVFIIEPDFWQFAQGNSRQKGGPLSHAYMRDFFNAIVSKIKTQLPNALISFDTSAWMSQSDYQNWWSHFVCSQIDFINTSGGQARGDSANIKPNELSWSFVHRTSGKDIIADCGYGVGGGASNNCGPWGNSGNQNNRIKDGVVALSQGSGWVNVAKPSV